MASLEDHDDPGLWALDVGGSGGEVAELELVERSALNPSSRIVDHCELGDLAVGSWLGVVVLGRQCPGG